jgi:hypothetical protein
MGVGPPVPHRQRQARGARSGGCTGGVSTDGGRVVHNVAMMLELSDEQAEDLRSVLDTALHDMSSEIAATDNPSYRAILHRQRDHVTEIRSMLG